MIFMLRLRAVDYQRGSPKRQPLAEALCDEHQFFAIT
jgi:hypothetical protein